MERTGLRRRGGRRRHPRPLLSDDGCSGHRAGGGARRRAAGHGHRPADRPAVRLGPAGRAVRGDAGAGRRVRGRAGRGGGVDVECAVLLHGHAVGDRHRAGGHAPRRAVARAGDGRGDQLPGAGRDARDGREPPPGVRHSPPGAGRVRRREPPSGRSGDRGRPLRRRDRAGRGHDPQGRRDGRARRAHPTRHARWRSWRRCGRSSAGTTPTPPSPPATPRGRTTARPICVVTHPARAEALGLRPLARLVSWGVGGVAPATMGIGPVPAVARALDAADVALKDVDLIELNEAFAAQVLAVHPGVVVRRRRLRPAQRQRLRHLARPSGRRHRRPDPGHPHPGDGPARRPLRPRDHVHRRRPGSRRPVRTGLTPAGPSAAP